MKKLLSLIAGTVLAANVYGQNQTFTFNFDYDSDSRHLEDIDYMHQQATEFSKQNSDTLQNSIDGFVFEKGITQRSIDNLKGYAVVLAGDATPIEVKEKGNVVLKADYDAQKHLPHLLALYKEADTHLNEIASPDDSIPYYAMDHIHKIITEYATALQEE